MALNAGVYRVNNNVFSGFERVFYRVLSYFLGVVFVGLFFFGLKAGGLFFGGFCDIWHYYVFLVLRDRGFEVFLSLKSGFNRLLKWFLSSWLRFLE